MDERYEKKCTPEGAPTIYPMKYQVYGELEKKLWKLIRKKIKSLREHRKKQ